MQKDLILFFISIALLVIYTFLVLGNFSPIGCRSCSALAGLICVVLAWGSSGGLCMLCGL